MPTKKKTLDPSENLIRSFHKERRLVLNDTVTNKESRGLTASIMSLTVSDEPILLSINSNGGSYWDGHYLYDAVRMSPAPITGLVIGTASSVACVILQACKQRIITKHSRILVHPPSFFGTVEFEAFSDNDQSFREMRTNLKEFHRNIRRTEDLLLEHCNLSREQLRSLMRKDRHLEAYEALKAGFVDEIV